MAPPSWSARLPQHRMSLLTPWRGHAHVSQSDPHPNQVWRLDLASSHLETMTSRNQIQSRQIQYYNYTRLMSVVPKTAGLVSPGGMQTPLFPGDRICCPVWVGGLLKLLKTCYNGSSVMVRKLASTRNEPSHPVERTCARLSVWPSP
jgi:hypothetical protein